MARPLALRSCLPEAPEAAGVWMYMRSVGADDVQRTRLRSNCVGPEHIRAHTCFLLRLVPAQKLSYPRIGTVTSQSPSARCARPLCWMAAALLVRACLLGAHIPLLSCSLGPMQQGC